jgi:hypothetical protein
VGRTEVGAALLAIIAAVAIACGGRTTLDGGADDGGASSGASSGATTGYSGSTNSNPEPGSGSGSGAATGTPVGSGRGVAESGGGAGSGIAGNPCNFCLPGTQCLNGVCMCPPGYTECVGPSGEMTACVSEQSALTDSKNCGHCGIVCPVNEPVCLNGICMDECTAAGGGCNFEPGEICTGVLLAASCGNGNGATECCVPAEGGCDQPAALTISCPGSGSACGDPPAALVFPGNMFVSGGDNDAGYAEGCVATFPFCNNGRRFQCTCESDGGWGCPLP